MKFANVAATTDLGCRLDLGKVAAALPSTHYEPEIYYALIFRATVAKMSCLVNTSGKVVLTGGKSIEECRAGLAELVADLNSVGFQASAGPIQVQNLVVTGNLHRTVQLSAIDAMARWGFDVEYEPEQFPGAMLRRAGTKATLLVFKSGAFNLVGCKGQEEIESIVALLAVAVDSVPT